MGNDTDQTGSINVKSKPSEAKIHLSYEDGNDEDIKEITPHTFKGKKPGMYRVTVSLAEDSIEYSNSKEVNVEAGSTAIVNSTIFTPEIKKKIRRIGYYTIFFIIILTIIAIATRLNIIIPPDDLTKSIIFVACSGGLGGLAFNMYVYVYHIGRKEDFNPEYEYSYYLRPFLGILYGTFVFFLVAGGLMALSGTSAPVSENLFTTKSVMFYIALSFVAGYAEEPFSIQLKALAEALFKEPSDDDKKIKKE